MFATIIITNNSRTHKKTRKTLMTMETLNDAIKAGQTLTQCTSKEWEVMDTETGEILQSSRNLYTPDELGSIEETLDMALVLIEQVRATHSREREMELMDCLDSLASH